jgi:hypothetical protein
MPLLQVHDFPDDIYEEITYVAHQQDRTIAQEVIVLIKKGLEEEITNRERVEQVLERINSRDVPEAAKKLDSTQVINQMREERSTQLFNTSYGKTAFNDRV